jgi:hypothetical protein
MVEATVASGGLRTAGRAQAMLQSTASEPPLTVVTTPLDVAVAAVKMVD